MISSQRIKILLKKLIFDDFVVFYIIAVMIFCVHTCIFYAMSGHFYALQIIETVYLLNKNLQKCHRRKSLNQMYVVALFLIIWPGKMPKLTIYFQTVRLPVFCVLAYSVWPLTTQYYDWCSAPYI